MEFIKYESTPGEKHLGIASVKLYGKIILRYKIVPTKDGASFFAAPSAFKMSATDTYQASVLIDSHSENEMLMNFIKENVKKAMQHSPALSCEPRMNHTQQMAIEEPELPF